MCLVSRIPRTSLKFYHELQGETSVRQAKIQIKIKERDDGLDCQTSLVNGKVRGQIV